MSVLPFGVALILRFAGLPVFTAVGIAILALWLLPEAVSRRIFGEYERGSEMFFGAGVSLVVGATFLVVNDLDLLVAGFVDLLTGPPMTTTHAVAVREP